METHDAHHPVSAAHRASIYEITRFVQYKVRTASSAGDCQANVYVKQWVGGYASSLQRSFSR